MKEALPWIASSIVSLVLRYTLYGELDAIDLVLCVVFGPISAIFYTVGFFVLWLKGIRIL